jgi:FtsP/CotA-like multicopper oxidase with cupredoxin domain
MTIRARKGDLARVAFQNNLPQHSILHWHGLSVPEAADGAPRLDPCLTACRRGPSGPSSAGRGGRSGVALNTPPDHTGTTLPLQAYTGC